MEGAIFAIIWFGSGFLISLAIVTRINKRLREQYPIYAPQQLSPGDIAMCFAMSVFGPLNIGGLLFV